MAHNTINTPQIVIEIPDSNTGLKRKASLHTMTYDQKNKALTLTWIVNYYKNDEGEYGDIINGVPGIVSYSEENIADNRTIVNMATGEILKPEDEIIETVDEVETRTGTWPGVDNTMGQYDFFYMIAQNQPLMVHEMIEQYGNLATWND